MCILLDEVAGRIRQAGPHGRGQRADDRPSILSAQHPVSCGFFSVDQCTSRQSLPADRYRRGRHPPTSVYLCAAASRAIRYNGYSISNLAMADPQRLCVLPRCRGREMDHSNAAWIDGPLRIADFNDRPLPIRRDPAPVLTPRDDGGLGASTTPLFDATWRRSGWKRGW